MYAEDHVLKELRQKCTPSLRAFCREHKLDPGHVSRALSGKAKLRSEVAEALGYHRHVVYLRRPGARDNG